jgi:hypothetical protein
MTIIVEDGTGLANAESYVSVVDANTYHSKIGNDAWNDLDTSVKEQLLRKATDYMVAQYRLQYAGYRRYSTQSLDWPRLYVPLIDSLSANVFPQYVDFDIVPTTVKNACAELALKSYTAILMQDLTQGVIREKVDVIEVEYDKYSPQQTRYAQIDAMLSVFFKQQGNDMSRSLVRT